MEYELRAGQPPALPPFIEGTTDLVARPRPGRTVAAVSSPRNTEIQVERGEPLSTIRIPQGHVHLGLWGVQFTLPPTLVNMDGGQLVGAGSVYTRVGLVEVTPENYAEVHHNPLLTSIAQHWRGRVITLLQRTRPAVVLGQIAPGVEGWLRTDSGEYRVMPYSFLVREQDGQGTRIVPIMAMDHEFEGAWRDVRTPHPVHA